MKKQILVLMFMLNLSYAVITNAHIPELVPIDQMYSLYFETTSEQCYITVEREDGHILKYFEPSYKQCEAVEGNIICTPDVLIPRDDGFVSFKFKVDSEYFQVGNTYNIIVDCGEDTENSTMYTVTKQVPNQLFNWLFFGITNSDYVVQWAILFLTISCLFVLYIIGALGGVIKTIRKYLKI